MQQWNDFISWISSDDGWRIVSTAILPFVAIVLAGLIAALIGRNSVKRVIDFQVKGIQGSAVTALIEAGRSSAKWSSLMSGQQAHAESEFIAADIRLRLLPLTGAIAAADWASHEVAEMRKNSATFSFQAEQSFVEYRDRLLEWQRHPNRARKLFATDLERFRIEDAQADAEVVEQQRLWAANEAAAAAEPTAAPSSFALASTPTPAYPAPTAFAPVPSTFAAVPATEVLESAPEPVAAPEHVNAAVDESAPVLSEAVDSTEPAPFTPQPDDSESSEPELTENHTHDSEITDDEPSVNEPDRPEPVYTDEDRNEDDPVPASEERTEPAETKAFPLSYFDPIPQRPAFPRRDED